MSAKGREARPRISSARSAAPAPVARLGWWLAPCLLLACTPSPGDVVRSALGAAADGPPGAVLAHLAEDYTDPLGDRGEIERWLARTRPRGELQLGFSGELPDGPRAVLGTLSARLTGLPPSFAAEGPLRVEVGADRRIRTGFLSELRSALAVVDERARALEANDAGAYGALLHPDYADPGVDRAAALRRIAADLEGRVVRLRALHVGIELRPHLAHVDLLEELSIDGAPPAPLRTRLTLRAVGGRYRIAAGLYGGPPP